MISSASSTMKAITLLSLILALLFSGSISAFGQGTAEGTLAGVVMSRETGSPIPFASVFVEETKLGAATNVQGEFVIGSIFPGSYTVIVRSLGYEEWRSEEVAIGEGRTVRLRVLMRESVIPLSEVQVIAERARRQSDIRASTLSVAPTRAKTLPGVAEDVLRTLQSLPGVLAPSDFSSQLAIRGSGPDQNLIIMDDIEVFNPYRLYGLISMFNPETASEIGLITGGFPAKYGDRLSAVLDVTNREGDRARGIGGVLNASITNANIVLNGGAPFDLAGSYMVSARRTYYDLILGPIARKTGLVSGDVAFPNFMDAQAKLVIEPWQGSRIVGNALFSRDGVQLISGAGRKQPDSVNVVDETRNDVAGLTWHYYPTRNFIMKTGVSWYRNTGDTEFGGDFIDPALNRERFEGGGDTTGIRFFNVSFDSRYEFRKVSVKSEVNWSLPGHLLETGAGVDFLRTSLIWRFRPDDTFRAIMQSRGIAYLEDFTQSREYARMNLYVQDKIRIGDAIAVQPGLRIDHYDIIRKTYLSPRLNVSYAVDPLTTLRAAWGVYRQSPGYEKLLDQNQFVDLTSAAYGKLGAERATHYVLGADRWITNEWQIRIEGYLKVFDDVIVQEILDGTTYTTTPVPGGDPRRRDGWTEPVATFGDSLTTNPVNGGTGSSYGLEILLEKKNAGPDSRISGWIGYSLAKAERVRGDIRTPFRFDQRHTVDIVLDYRVNDWLSVGVRWKYGTNFPYTQPLGLKPRLVNGSATDPTRKIVQVDRQGSVIFDLDRGGEANRYSARLPEYHRLDVRATAKTDFWGLAWDFYIDVINVYNRSNVLNYRFYANSDFSIGRTEVTMFPILPTIGFCVRF